MGLKGPPGEGGISSILRMEASRESSAERPLDGWGVDDVVSSFSVP